ncbi:hypothetical protein [Enterococcus cecorum]|uniref:hypothetical protein n=1 Tax=Enterococcus cecorum TaxID=44008 RepID=UPI00064297BA|nr:hypothetical protein [Enterococcus cecorum]
MNKFLEKVKTKVDIKKIKEIDKLSWDAAKFIIFIYGVIARIVLSLSLIFCLFCFLFCLFCFLAGIPL